MCICIYKHSHVYVEVSENGSYNAGIEAKELFLIEEMAPFFIVRARPCLRERVFRVPKNE